MKLQVYTSTVQSLYSIIIRPPSLLRARLDELGCLLRGVHAIRIAPAMINRHRTPSSAHFDEEFSSALKVMRKLKQQEGTVRSGRFDPELSSALHVIRRLRQGSSAVQFRPALAADVQRTRTSTPDAILPWRNTTMYISYPDYREECKLNCFAVSTKHRNKRDAGTEYNELMFMQRNLTKGRPGGM